MRLRLAACIPSFCAALTSLRRARQVTGATQWDPPEGVSTDHPGSAEAAAAKKVQSLFRGGRARAAVKAQRAALWKASYDTERGQYKYVHTKSGLWTYEKPAHFKFDPVEDPHWRAAIRIQSVGRMFMAKLRVAIMRRARAHKAARQQAAEEKMREFQSSLPGPRVSTQPFAMPSVNTLGRRVRVDLAGCSASLVSGCMTLQCPCV